MFDYKCKRENFLSSFWVAVFCALLVSPNNLSHQIQKNEDHFCWNTSLCGTHIKGKSKAQFLFNFLDVATDLSAKVKVSLLSSSSKSKIFDLYKSIQLKNHCFFPALES